ncbi:MAG TPA: hypothetical protein VHX61_06460 [Rhizomicrobium sp.]|nr:hypothetical protein [Rhizomicrobium sp.]
MKNWFWVAVAALAVTGGYGTDASAYMAGFGHRGASGFFHEFRDFRGHPLPAFHSRGFGRFGAGRFAGNDEAVGDDDTGDYDDSYDPGLDALHFRVQEPFGPGDIGRPQAPEGPYGPTAW